jgi:hypothetical protein
VPSRRLRISLWTAAGVLLTLGIAVTVLKIEFQPLARNYAISALKKRYKSDVELGGVQISLFPTVHATGQNLVLRLSKEKNMPPMVVIRRFTVEARFAGLFDNPKRIRKLTLEGLQLHIPPRSGDSHDDASANGSADSEVIPFILEEVIADGTTLETLPADPQKDPLKFAIHQLTLHSVGARRPMTFHAELENAKPPGFIHSDGDFGPWNPDEPGDTPLGGKYTFSNADLSVFHGIGGHLSSSGQYRGQLARIDVHGTTDVPDFSLSLADHPMHLRTRFEATVDGTNGNTDLHPVHAVLDDSAFDVSGSIERNALQKHKEIDLQAETQGTDLEDFLRLSVNGSRPPMTGDISFKTKVKIPPGENPVVDRLQLEGIFTLRRVKFTSATVQQKIASLSHHAQGEPKDTSTTGVNAAFAGRFRLRAGVLALPRLRFEVPGADVRLDGQYKLRSGDIDFKGTARLDATISQMTTGIKHILLKPLDPLFKHDGAGAVVPITISGTRGSPSFRLDIGRILKP